MDEELRESKSEFLSVYNKFVRREGAKPLLEWLESSDFFVAPASTRYHGAHVGGLLQHSLNVYRVLRDEVQAAGFSEKYSEETVAIVALLHDVCKVGQYVLEPKNQKTYDPEKVKAAKPNEVKRDSLGDFTWEQVMKFAYGDDSLPYGHGEKSAYIVSGFMKLTREEAMAIRWHMGFSDNDFRGGGKSVGKAFELFPLAFLTHIADMKATYLMEE